MVDIYVQQSFYDKKWRDFAFAGNYGLARCIAILKAVHGLGFNYPSIIDIGTGAGWLASVLGQFGPTFGVELSEEAVRKAREKYPHVEFISADIFNWDLPVGSFDIAVSQEVIEHVEAPELFIEINHKLLKVGGYLILTTPNARAMNCTDETTARNWTNQPIENWLSTTDMRRLLTPMFTDIKIRTIIPTSMPRKGMYRIFNNRLARGLLLRTHTKHYFDAITLRLGYGLHQVVIAKKR